MARYVKDSQGWLADPRDIGGPYHARPCCQSPNSHNRGFFSYGLVVATGDTWREQRRFSLQTLRNFGLGRNIMEERILIEAKKLSQSLVDQLNAKNEVILDLALPLQYCMGNIISSILFGYAFEKGDKRFEFLKETLDENLRVF